MEAAWNGIERRTPPGEAPPAQAQMHSILQASPVGFGLTIDRIIQSVSPSMTTITGYAADELIGHSARVLYPSDEDFAYVGREKYAQIAITGGGAVETRWRRKDGALLHILLTSVPVDATDLSRGVSFTAIDITLRKEQELRRLADMEKQREVLVREVHHRIKNNLQSVAGLLRRELGLFMDLDPHLEKAITQVHAIAVVHGLQSTDPDEAIRLCNTVDHICSTLREQTQRPIDYQIEHEQTTFRPIQINRDEAVAVALILNELILNAVKHTPDQDLPPRVSLASDGERARIIIRNRMRPGCSFDLAQDTGLKTGLRLVKSLLPEQGAHLDFLHEADGYLVTSLLLEAPVVQTITGKGT